MAEELRRIRDAAREGTLKERRPGDVLGPPPEVATAGPAPPPEVPAAAAPAAPPDLSAVSASWDVRDASAASGAMGGLARLARRLLAPFVNAQATFNSRQVQLDHDLVAYVHARLEATHRHYDGVLGAYGRHLHDIDKRHLILPEELVPHVHDLVRRIDLVLAESERSRLSLELALRDLRARLAESLPAAASRDDAPRR